MEEIVADYLLVAFSLSFFFNWSCSLSSRYSVKKCTILDARAIRGASFRLLFFAQNCMGFNCGKGDVIKLCCAMLLAKYVGSYVVLCFMLTSSFWGCQSCVVCYFCSLILMLPSRDALFPWRCTWAGLHTLLLIELNAHVDFKDYILSFLCLCLLQVSPRCCSLSIMLLTTEGG